MDGARLLGRKGITAPTDTTFEEGCGWHIQEAYRYDLSALEKLEGAAPDLAGATADLGMARGALATAIALTPDFVDAKIGKQTVRYLVRVDKRLEKASGRRPIRTRTGPSRSCSSP